MSSILEDIKHVLGLDPNYIVFDRDLVLHINSVLMILNQLGVGPEDGYTIENEENTWDEFLPSGKLLESVKSFIYLKIRLLFDPPSTSFAIDSMNKLASEFEWRICVQAGQMNKDDNIDTVEEVMEALEDHINDEEPHPAYDEEIPSLKLIFENGLI